MGECLIIKSNRGIDTSNTTASGSTILNGYTAYVNNEKVTGSMINRGSVTSSLNPGEIYTALEGWYDGTGKVSVSSLSSNTSGTAQTGWILSGYNAWVNGNKLTGTMNNRGNQSWSLAANGAQVIWSGFYDGTGKVSQSLTTSAGGTWTPTTSNKTLVNASTWVSGTWYVAGASTLTAANIKKDVTIFGVKGTWTGYVSGDFVLYEKDVFYTPYTINTDYNGWGSYTLQTSRIDIYIYISGYKGAYVLLYLRVPEVKGIVTFTMSSVSETATLKREVTLGIFVNTDLGFTSGNFTLKVLGNQVDCTGDFTSTTYRDTAVYPWIGLRFITNYSSGWCSISKISYRSI